MTTDFARTSSTPGQRVSPLTTPHEPRPASRVAVVGVGHALPGEALPGATVSNDELFALRADAARDLRRSGSARQLAEFDAAFPETRIGVRSRRVLDQSVDTRALAVAAARDGLARSGVDARAIELVIVTTVTPDGGFPATACSVQAELGLSNDVAAYDLSLGCNGFLGALDVAQRMLAGAPEGSAALVVAAECLLRVVDAGDRDTCGIFGDGAGAAVVARTGEGGLTAVRTRTFGDRAALIRSSLPPADALPILRLTSQDGVARVRPDVGPGRRVEMSGRRVYRDMVALIPRTLRADLEAHDLAPGDVDTFVFHQANRRMIEAIAASRELALDEDRLLFDMEELGNTGSASIPILLSRAVEAGRVRPGTRVALVGFGTGYSVGTTVIEWNATTGARR